MRKKQSTIFNKRNMIGLFIILIMTMSVLGIYVGSGSDTSDKYNGFKFVQAKNGFLTEINDKQIIFYNHPSSLEYIFFDNVSKDILKNAKMLIITFDPADPAIQEIELTRLELTTQLQQFANIYIITGISNQTAPYAQFPLITCANATAYQPVIYFKTGETTAITAEGSCITAAANYIGAILTLKDRIAYQILGIMN
ncbi:hypothetical protein J4232_03270 [Candidatus Woesearchaeota archaeon]|nr:hypothetical protein [Candidatus Woesearchaeota archaeon]